MRVGHFASGHPGGVASYIRRLTEAQRAAGHEVCLLTQQSASDGDRDDSTIVVESAFDLYARARAVELDVLHLHISVDCLPPEDLTTVRTVHAHEAYCPSGTRHLRRRGRPCDRSAGYATCLWGHLLDHCGSVRPHKLLGNFRGYRRERDLLRSIPVLAISRFQKEWMVRAGYPANRIFMLHHFAPPASDYRPPADDDVPRFLFAGRIVPRKGLEWLLRACAKVRQPIHLDIAGTGYFEETVRRLARRLRIEHRLTFHGWTDEAGIQALLRRSRALVFPSVWHEPAGLVALEAMASGRAILASSTGGIPEAVTNGLNGLLVEPGDEKMLTRSLELLASDLDLAERLGQRGRQLAHTRFGKDRHLTLLTAIYEAAIKNRTIDESGYDGMQTISSG